MAKHTAEEYEQWIKELKQALPELSKLAGEDKSLHPAFIQGYQHVAKMVENWCCRQLKEPYKPVLKQTAPQPVAKPVAKIFPLKIKSTTPKLN